MTTLNDTDMLVGRLIIGLQSETQLECIDIEAMSSLLQNLPGHLRSAFLPADRSGLMATIDRLENAGYIGIDRSNPHVSVAFKGLLLCGPLRLPEALATAVKEALRDQCLE